jgi:hypothetical protein
MGRRCCCGDFWRCLLSAARLVPSGIFFYSLVSLLTFCKEILEGVVMLLYVRVCLC